MRWLRVLALVGAFVLVGALVVAWGGLTGDPDDSTPDGGSDLEARIACAAELPPRQQVGQLVALGVDGQAPELQADRVAELGVGTVLLRDLSPDRPVARIEALKEASTIPPLVGVAEEGGTVQALRQVLGPFPSAQRMALDATPEEAEALARSRGQSMAALGVDLVLAPVVDVAGDDRSFGTDPATVTTYAEAYVDAYVAAGLLPTLRHFPGRGSAPLPDRRQRDLIPYDTLLEEPVAVMVGHAVVPDVTIFGPASLSAGIVTDLLRDEYGFDGLVLTDALPPRPGPPATAAVEAIQAGADVALFTQVADPGAVLDRLEQALRQGALDADQVATSVVRVLDAKGVDPCAL